MIRIPCSKCGSTDHDKYRRMKKRKSGKYSPSMASFCILCHREDRRVRDERRYHKKLAYNREWRKKNKEKKNEYARRWYARKKRNPLSVHPSMVEWHGKTSSDGFSALTYVSLYPGPPWGNGRKMQ